MKKVSVSVPGKCILFGEHAVVHGYPAIAMAINLNSKCSIQESAEKLSSISIENFDEKYEFSSLHDLRMKIDEDFKQFIHCLEYFNTNHNLEFDRIKISLSSEISPGTGLGSSASISVALICGISHFYGIEIPLKDISKLAFQMEEITHGKPSGIDNAICTYGGSLFFQKGNFHSIDIPENFEILLTYSNEKHNTKQAVAGIREMKFVQPKFVNGIFERIGLCTEMAEKSLINGNFKEIGDLMKVNQLLLNSLHLSSDQIAEIVKISLDNGAFGSKLTGAGLGGCVITLGEKSILDNITHILKAKGFSSFYSKINRKGINVTIDG